MDTHLAGKYKGETETYYVISTDTKLPAEAMRELAKTRWHIENETFKALNEQCHSKHAFIREGSVSLLLILFMSL
jgi:IS4 transposase